LTKMLSMFPVLVLVMGVLSCGEDKDCRCGPAGSSTRCGYVYDYDQSPVLISLPAPIYPEEARRNGVEGVVHVLVGVGTDSFPCGVEVASSDAAVLELPSLEAALGSKWAPARRKGVAVATEVDVPMRFTLHLSSAEGQVRGLGVVCGP
jgi:TonB family protein